MEAPRTVGQSHFPSRPELKQLSRSPTFLDLKDPQILTRQLGSILSKRLSTRDLFN